ncbi:Retrovirus-related Pol polyprotein from transposon RE1 [Cardamine amara subsp. amara]|uniref:Retrovirus-related Pol polyprotein from transposon RE1 n=1 Tax=Cardamine amara subsp. amara TaxID=228776 RepID=A0ABD1B8J9_CARAN
MSMTLAVREIELVRYLLGDFVVTQTEPTDLHCDNQAALYIAAKPVFHERTKTVEIDCHNVRDAMQAESIRTKKVHTKEQLADVFIKALGQHEFEPIVSELGSYNLHAQLEGGGC